MPAAYAHYRFGQEVLERLPQKIQNRIRPETDLYHIGLHGPDIFFYCHPLTRNSISALGYRLHDEPGIRFFKTALAIACSRDLPGAGLSYLYGFICHFVLDSTCHGYIDGTAANDTLTHADIETAFDRYLLLHDGLNPLHADLTLHIHTDSRTCSVIASFFPHITPDDIDTCLRSFKKTTALLQAPYLWQRSFLQMLFHLSGHFSELNGLLMTRTDIPGSEQTDTRMMMLYELAKKDAIRLITDLEYTKEGFGWDDLYNYTFNSVYVESCEEKRMKKI